MKNIVTICILLLLPVSMASAESGLTALTVTGSENGGQTYSLSIQILLLMTVLTLLPAGLMMMTSFTRIIIVLAILRQALGTAQTPTTQTLVGLALFLTIFIMMPVFNDVYDNALEPYMDEEVSAQKAIAAAIIPFRTFMISQTRDSDINMFSQITGDSIETPEDVPFTLLVPAFITSELKTAFQIGFLIFIPFLIIDLVVASVLMSMGMMMLSPLIISLPFKIMLFVLVDGWSLILGTLASSFYT